MGVGVVTRNVSPSRGMDVWGHFAISPFRYVGPNPYATGGDPILAQQFKLGVVEFIDIGVGIKADGTAAIVFCYNPATAMMQAFWQNPTAGASEALQEVDNGTDLSGYTAFGMAMGKG